MREVHKLLQKQTDLHSFIDILIPKDGLRGIAGVVGRGVHVKVEQCLLQVMLLAGQRAAAGRPGLLGQHTL